MSQYLKRFSELPTYSDPGSQSQTCSDLLPHGIVPNLMVCSVHLGGNGRNTVGNHDAWHQVFIVISGSATLLRGEERTPITAPCVIHIPPHTDHDILTSADEHIDYICINQYLSGQK